MSGSAANGQKSGWRPKGNIWLIAVLATLGAFMEVLDTTIVNVALPHIAGSLSVSNDDATWTLTSYLVANGIVLTISGWLGRALGRKRYFLICISMFAVCSLGCGLSQNLPEIIIFRLLQGFFGGGLQPTQQAIILDTFPPDQRGKAFALAAVATVVAPVLGPALGGWITDNFSWPWIFFINVPVAALTFFGVLHLVEDPPWAKARGLAGIDSVGLGLITVGLGSLQVMMDRGEDEDWFGSTFIRVFGCLAVTGILGAIAWLLYTRKPIVNIRVLKDSNFAISSVLITMMAAVLYASAVVIPQLAQQVLGYSATLAGLILSPGALMIVVLIPFVLFMQKFVPTKYSIAFGFACLGVAMIYSSNLEPNVSFITLVLMRTAQTIGLAFLFAPLSTIAFANIAPEDNGDAAALFTMFRNVAGSIGISAATAAITNSTQVRMAYLSRNLSPLNQGYSFDLQAYKNAIMSFPGQAMSSLDQTAAGRIYLTLRAQASILAYSDIFGFCAVGAFLAIPMALFLSSKKIEGGAEGGVHA